MDYTQTDKLAQSLNYIAHALAEGLHALTQAGFSIARALERIAEEKEAKG